MLPCEYVLTGGWREEINLRVFEGVTNTQVSLCAQQLSLNICICAASSLREISCDITGCSYRPPTARMHMFIFRVSCAWGCEFVCALKKTQKQPCICMSVHTATQWFRLDVWMSIWIYSHACLYLECPLMSCFSSGEWRDGSHAAGRNGTRGKKICVRKPLHMENARHIRAPTISLQRHPSLCCTAATIYRPLTLFPLTFPLLPPSPLLPLLLSFPVTFPLCHSLHCFTFALHHSPAPSLAQTFQLPLSDTAVAQCRDH